ncbi:MAG: electron transfer flavoprotein subunit beta/FixA family protein, partial [Gammaproteobacteria bacterium]|nr:electron transfer flavoprotein subunit beta/FixA family protein [Gammaproteobacteria bacterium]
MRKILVAVKRVVDYSVRVHVRDDGSGVETDGVKMSMNPFDEIAVEEALRLREAGHADEVTAVSIGTAEVQQQLRTALAMGADRAIHVAADGAIDSLTAARVLFRVVATERPLLALLGKQAIDTDNNQTGQMLAALWQRPQATFASSIRIDGDTATVGREVDSGIETIEIDLPAVITTDLRLNEPRYVKLPQLLKAKKMPIERLTIESLDVSVNEQFRVLATER